MTQQLNLSYDLTEEGPRAESSMDAMSLTACQNNFPLQSASMQPSVINNFERQNTQRNSIPGANKVANISFSL